MDTEQQMLTLPEGYTIEPTTELDDRRLLALTRRDGSAVAIFEFSALGPDPRRIWQIAWDDAEDVSGPPWLG